jgi:hypothetical protein
MYRVQGFEIVAPHTLHVSFDDATQQLIDFEPVLRGELYGPLRDLTLFNQVSLDRESHTLIWQTVRISTPPHFTIGPSVARPSPRWHRIGNSRVCERSLFGFLKIAYRTANLLILQTPLQVSLERSPILARSSPGSLGPDTCVSKSGSSQTSTKQKPPNPLPSLLASNPVSLIAWSPSFDRLN